MRLRSGPRDKTWRDSFTIGLLELQPRSTASGALITQACHPIAHLDPPRLIHLQERIIMFQSKFIIFQWNHKQSLHEIRGIKLW